jgi:hypothetical protein
MDTLGATVHDWVNTAGVAAILVMCLHQVGWF